MALTPAPARGRAPGGVRGEGPQALREGRALARAAAGFRRGRLAAVYLPPAYPLDGFEYAIAPLIGGGPEEAYARLAALLGELASWARYARWRWREAAERCAGSDGAAPALLSVGRESLLGLAEMVAHPARMGVSSPAAALYELAALRAPRLLECRDARRALREAAAVLGGLLVALGAALHWDPSRPLRLRAGIPAPRALRPTALTGMLARALQGAARPGDYIGAWRGLVECVARLADRPAEVAAARCAGVLEGWREMGAAAEDLFVRATVYTLYDLIAALERRP
ncbi:MAG: hypothetical protein LM577_00790 [Thermoproteaceae archaeon]|nr:hypothetical protein [Thermoproteaceae archaeon]